MRGRYLTQLKRKSQKIRERMSDFSLDRARQRLNCELKKIEVSQRINNRTESHRSRLILLRETSRKEMEE